MWQSIRHYGTRIHPLVLVVGFLSAFLLYWYDENQVAQQFTSSDRNKALKNHTARVENEVKVGESSSLVSGVSFADATEKKTINLEPFNHDSDSEHDGNVLETRISLTTNLSWIPVTEQEKQEYTGNKTCVGPLKHCCIGQCRQPFNAMKSTDSRLFRKPNAKLSNLTDLLLLLERVKIPPETACRIVMLGDSLIGDHVAALICQLYRLGYTAIKCINKEQFGTDRRYGEKRFCRARNKGPGPFTLFLERPDNIVCPNVTLQTTRPAEYDHTIALEPESSGIMVWSDGVHRNKPGEVRQFMQEHFVNMTRDIHINFPHWYVVFLEHEPQHFKTIDGTWRNKVNKCRSLNVTNTSNWRNEEAVQTIVEENLQIPVVPLWHQMLPLWDLHIGKGDCTHYCYVPWRFDVTWHGIIEAVEPLLKARSRDNQKL